MSRFDAFIIGVLVGGLFAFWLEAMFEHDDVPLQIPYEAYRLCISQSDCHMTPQDYVDYYNIKWKLEGKR